MLPIDRDEHKKEEKDDSCLSLINTNRATVGLIARFDSIRCDAMNNAICVT